MSIDLQEAFEQDQIVEDAADYVEAAPPVLAPVTDAPQELPQDAEPGPEPDAGEAVNFGDL